MGKYWYNDNGKWRQGSDEDDAALLMAILAIIFAVASWVFIKPIKWWIKKEEKPTKIGLIVWVAVVIGLVALIISTILSS